MNNGRVYLHRNAWMEGKSFHCRVNGKVLRIPDVEAMTESEAIMYCMYSTGSRRERSRRWRLRKGATPDVGQWFASVGIVPKYPVTYMLKVPKTGAK